MTSWHSVLTAAGVHVDLAGPGDVSLRYDGQRVAAHLLEASMPLTPAKIERLTEGPGLLVVPRVTTAARAAARRRRWGVVTLDGVVDLRGLNIPLTVGDQSATQARPHGRRGPRPYASMAVLRRLAAAPGYVTQWRLAQLADVSQPQAHRAIKPLVDRGFVHSGANGLKVSQRVKLIEHWLSTYPGPGGSETYWVGLDPAPAQAFAVLQLPSPKQGPGEAEGPAPRTALSGDVAADLLAPWRQPARALVYASRPPRLDGGSLVPSASAQDATLQMVSPSDPGVWLPHPWPGLDVPVADPLQILWDLRRAPGPDADEAADHLCEALLGQLSDQWAAASGFYDH